MDVIWTDRARLRLKEINAYIARDQPRNAKQWVDRLIKRGDAVGEQPWAGRTVPEYEEETIREVFLGDYRIIYEIASACVYILTVRHGSRLLPPQVSDT